jgi:hypothetical protein
MTRSDQRKFVRGLTASIRDSVLQSIATGDVPAEWDGHELRCLLANRFEQSAQMTYIRKEPRSRRTREFNNTIRTTPSL